MTFTFEYSIDNDHMLGHLYMNSGLVPTKALYRSSYSRGVKIWSQLRSKKFLVTH